MAGPVLFTDNFDAETPGAGAVPSNWSALNGTVDILGSGPNGTADDLLPGNGYYVDLDGNGTPGYLVTQQAFLLEAGVDYLLSFDLAGNNCGSANGNTIVVAFLDGSFLTSYTVDENDAFTAYSVELPGDGATHQIVFYNSDSTDGNGAKLDNVTLTDMRQTPSVPAPGAMLLGGLGTSLVGWLRRCQAV